jgi:purine-nucleoside phosphorylase
MNPDVDMRTLEKAADFIRKKWKDVEPVCGLILGSGWGPVVDSFNSFKAMDYEEIPGLGKTGVAGHSGRLVWGEASGIETLIFQGRRHYYEGAGWTPIALPVFVLRSLGATKLLITNAAGGIRSDLKTGKLMIIDDHINWIGANPLMGPHRSFWGPRFPDQSEVYDAQLRRLLERAGKKAKLELAHGVYLAGSGPVYETPAEIRAYRAMGADAVGMSTVPEAMLAKASGLRVAGLSCITNSAAGISPDPLSHEEVTQATQEAMPGMKAVILEFWKEMQRAGI